MAEHNNAQIARIVTETGPHTLYLALADIQRMAPGIQAREHLIRFRRLLQDRPPANLTGCLLATLKHGDMPESGRNTEADSSR